MHKNIFSMRLKIYDYRDNKFRFILVSPVVIKKHIEKTPIGYFPRFFINTDGKIISSYESGLNDKPDKVIKK
jgi:hypothetical protein